jgi:hypothetical protein
MDVLSTLNGVTAGASVEQVTLDFGTAPVWGKSFVAALPGAQPGDRIVISAERSDETEMDGLAASARVVLADQVEIDVHATPGPVTGSRVFNIVRG